MNNYKTFIISEELVVGENSTNCSNQIILELLKKVGAPIIGNFFLKIDPGYRVIEIHDKNMNQYKYIFEELVCL